MLTVKWTLVGVVVGYTALLALMYVAQRSLMYFPEKVRTPPAAAGLPEAQEIFLQTADGAGLLALSYRGYGGSSGSPSETGLIRDAEAAYEFAAARYGTARLALWGESLGTGVAVALAAAHPVAAIILDAPFTSAAAVGAAHYPFLPVRWLIKDPFYSDRRILDVRAPVLVLHGARDDVIPIALGEQLFALIPGPKQFVRFADAGHNDLDHYGATQAVREFLAKTFGEAKAASEPARKVR